MNLLVLGVAAALLALVLRGAAPVAGGAPARLSACLFATLPAALFLGVSFDEAPTGWRASLVGFGFRGEAAQEIVFGGDAEADVWTGAVDDGAGWVILRPVEGDASALEVSRVEGAGALVGRSSGRGTLRPLPSVELAVGDRLTLGERSWTFGPGGEQAVVLPPRRGRLPLLPVELELLRPRPGTERTFGFPLGPNAAASATWLFREPRGVAGESVWLTSIDPALRVGRGAEVRWPPDDPSVLRSGEHLHVLGAPRGGGGFRDLRSWRIRRDARGVTVRFDTPEVHVVGAADLDLLTLPSRSGELRIPLALGGDAPTESSLHFRTVSERMAAGAPAILSLPRMPAASGATYEVRTPRGSFTARTGRPVWLGGDRRLAVQLDPVRPPRPWAVLALAMAVARAVAARAARLRTPAVLVLAGIEGLVALRVVLAVRVSSRPPFAAEALDLAGVAWMLVPWAWIALAGSPREPGARVSPALAGLAASAAWAVALGGSRSLVWGLVHLGVAGLVLAVRARPTGRRLGRLDPGRWRRAPAVALAVATGVAAGRLGLLWLGFRESLELGPRFALSMVHVPLAILAEAVYLAWLVDRRREAPVGAREIVPGLLLLALLWFVPALLVSDLGLTVLGVPPFLVAWVLAAVPAARPTRAPWRRPAALPAWTLLAWFLVAATPWAARAALALVPDEAEAELRSERNYLRILEFADVERLEGVARRTSEEVAVIGRVMRATTRGPWTGRGWAATEISPHLSSTALREHVPSVLVAGGWGVAGVVGLLLLLGVILAGTEVAVDPARRPRPFFGLVAVLGGLGFVLPSIFMVAANVGLVPFTGKNASLLALDSTSDVLESLVLLVLLALGGSLAGARR